MTNDTTVATLRALVERGVSLHPELAGRIFRATLIALFRRVEPQADGSWLVESETEPGKLYRVTDWTTKDAVTCECPDVHRAPRARCKHKLAIMLVEAAARHSRSQREQETQELLDALGTAVRRALDTPAA